MCTWGVFEQAKRTNVIVYQGSDAAFFWSEWMAFDTEWYEADWGDAGVYVQGLETLWECETVVYEYPCSAPLDGKDFCAYDVSTSTTDTTSTDKSVTISGSYASVTGVTAGGEATYSTNTAHEVTTSEGTVYVVEQNTILCSTISKMNSGVSCSRE